MSAVVPIEQGKRKKARDTNELLMDDDLPTDPRDGTRLVNVGSPGALPSDVAEFSDLGNAYRLRALHGDDLRFCKSLGWLAYDGRRFAPDEIGQVDRCAHDLGRELLQEVAVLTLEASQTHDKNEAKAIMARADKLRAWTTKTQSAKGIRDMLTVASALDGIATSPAVFDRDPWLLNVSNGTIDLRTGKRRCHERTNQVTKLAPVEFDAGATCPEWLRFLETIFAGNAELVAFVQRALGYSLTGQTTEQCFFVLHGGGANGKSTYIETVRHVLGDYSMSTATDTFMRTRDGRGPENDVARLRGARFVAAVESGEGRKLDEERIKRLTGGDTVTARFLFREAFEFVATGKIWIAVNDKPQITGIDQGIWRRIRLLPFDVTIPAHQQDKALPAKLHAEASGILNWMISGCLDWQRNGLQTPGVVTASTADWRGEENTVGRFVDECCNVAESLSVRASAFASGFAEWAKLNGEEPLSGKALARRLKALQFKPGRNGQARLWLGLSLRSPGMDDT